jgi:hypothetical protein
MKLHKEFKIAMMLILFIAVFAMPKAQELQTPVKDSISVSQTRSGYVNLAIDRICDSVQFVVYTSDSANVTKLILTKSIELPNGPGTFIEKDYSTAVGDTSTITNSSNHNASSVAYVTTWAGSKLQGANRIKAQINANSSGNDATRNKIWVIALIYYRPNSKF